MMMQYGTKLFPCLKEACKIISFGNYYLRYIAAAQSKVTEYIRTQRGEVASRFFSRNDGAGRPVSADDPGDGSKIIFKIPCGVVAPRGNDCVDVIQALCKLCKVIEPRFNRKEEPK